MWYIKDVERKTKESEKQAGDTHNASSKPITSEKSAQERKMRHAALETGHATIPIQPTAKTDR
jgi:hypothetical protein